MCARIDIILECYERKPEKCQLPAFLGLIGQFNRTSVCQLLGFKFKQYHSADVPHGMSHHTYAHMSISLSEISLVVVIAPSSLFDVAAALIQAEVVGLAEIYPHVSSTIITLV